MLTPARRLVPATGLAAHIGNGLQRVATDAVVGRLAAAGGPTLDREELWEGVAALADLETVAMLQEVALMVLPFGEPRSTKAWT